MTCQNTKRARSNKERIPSTFRSSLGYSSITMTMDTYGHMFQNRNRGVVNGLDATPARDIRGHETQLSGTDSVHLDMNRRIFEGVDRIGDRAR